MRRGSAPACGHRLLTLHRAPCLATAWQRTMRDGASSPRASYHARSSSASHQPPSTRHEAWHASQYSRSSDSATLSSVLGPSAAVHTPATPAQSDGGTHPCQRWRVQNVPPSRSGRAAAKLHALVNLHCMSSGHLPAQRVTLCQPMIHTYTGSLQLAVLHAVSRLIWDRPPDTHVRHPQSTSKAPSAPKQQQPCPPDVSNTFTCALLLCSQLRSQSFTGPHMPISHPWSRP